MKNSNFWFWTLIVLLVFGVAMQWPVYLRIAVIANSLIVLGSIPVRIWRVYHE